MTDSASTKEYLMGIKQIFGMLLKALNIPNQTIRIKKMSSSE